MLDPAVGPMQILATEELSLNAWPADRTLCYDGWLLRLTGGYTRRANSVQALYPSALALTDKIAYCEQVYTAHGLDTIFKVTSAEQHRDLDACLATLGYSQEARTRVQVLHPPETEWPGAAALSFDAGLTERWLGAYARLSNLDARHGPALQRLLAAIVPEHRFVAMVDQATIIAVGLVVIERDYAGIFDVVVDASRRRQGIGTRLVRHLLQWAVQHGARQAYLQVVEENLPAQRLYANLGFRNAYTYWYRVKKAATNAIHNQASPEHLGRKSRRAANA